jgi:2-keto-4-pentenoate hydratase/2-oxohepta-3-ene-1,7-dioic acid hydratase in catechol pathway
MKIARVKHNNRVFYCALDRKGAREIKSNIFGEAFAPKTKQFKVNSKILSLSDIQILAPVNPPNIIAIGLNYKHHAIESGLRIPSNPVIFLKASTSIIGHNESIMLPISAPEYVDYEAELTIVIGKRAKNIGEREAAGYVLGYTCGNDVSARDCQLKLDVQWARGKSFDTFCPIGPWIETDVDPDNLSIQCRLNGRIVQKSSTSDMIFNVRQLVSFCSKNMTLLPGTIIMTGTPGGVGFARRPQIFLKDGDIIEVEIEGIGILKNKIDVERA